VEDLIYLVIPIWRASGGLGVCHWKVPSSCCMLTFLLTSLRFPIF